ncbi:hypothetical protein L2E82_17793 [Cichorium intybus]|uniref:Uncharacterized protein n=1 Tax=Cichorium intybus TaxID=13427 RepID=A0ACB9F9C2_CICIN|nr:hypothetical protein L2E82_17793 [Cichorium intybus]
MLRPDFSNPSLPYNPFVTQRLLLNPSYTFADVGIEDDVLKLKRDYNLNVGTMADLRGLTAENGRTDLGNVGLKGLTRIVLGKELKTEKFVMKSRWDKPWLLLGVSLKTEIE